MNARCDEIWDEVVNLAEGKEAPEARAHLQSCTECAHKFAQLERMVADYKLGYFAPPEDLVAGVKGLIKRAPKARLLRSTLAWNGARSAVAEDFQLVIDVAERQVRLMYNQVGSGWEVLGKVPTGWRVRVGNRELAVGPDGRLAFTAKSLGSTSFELFTGEEWVEVQSAEELLKGGTEPGH